MNILEWVLKCVFQGFSQLLNYYSSECACVEQVVLPLSTEVFLHYLLTLPRDSNEIQMGQIILTM